MALLRCSAVSQAFIDINAGDGVNVITGATSTFPMSVSGSRFYTFIVNCTGYSTIASNSGRGGGMVGVKPDGTVESVTYTPNSTNISAYDYVIFTQGDGTENFSANYTLA